jgi:ankyrin repeat protein
MLRGINKAQKDNAHRLLQCLSIAVRPLRVEELAGLLAFDFETSSSGGIATPKEDWRWDDEEGAILSTCSSLIAVVPSGRSRVVQFSHFSVKEYLTSPRLARSHGDVSRFYIDLDAAHTIMAQACLGILLPLDEHAASGGRKGFPLIGYAARHWMEHARSETVAPRVRGGMDDLFDSSQPHFAAWLRVHDLYYGPSWSSFYLSPPIHNGSPLYYSALYGLYDLSERLIAKHPEQINAVGGGIVAPLPAALYMRHFRVANLLHRHGAVVDIRSDQGRTPLYCASIEGLVDIMRWLLNHGADANAPRDDGRTPLHTAAANAQLEAVQLLLDHNAYVNSREAGHTPLSICLRYSPHKESAVDVVRRLLEHGADPNISARNHSTPLHQASSHGTLEVARLLHKYGAKVDEKDEEGKTPFQIALEKGYDEIAKLLSEHVDAPQL